MELNNEEYSIEAKIDIWICSKYADIQTKDASTGTKYYVITSDGKNVKIRLGNHKETHNDCDLYIQSLANCNNMVIIREKNSLYMNLYNYTEAISYICNYIDNSPTIYTYKVAAVNTPVSDNSNVIKFKNLTINDTYYTPDSIKKHWSSFIVWYGSIMNVSVKKMHIDYRNKLHDLFTGNVAFNNMQPRILKAYAESDNLYEAIDKVLYGKPLKECQISNQTLPVSMPSLQNIKDLLQTFEKYIINSNWISAIDFFQSYICYIGYNSLSDSDKEIFHKIFSNKYIRISTAYEIFSHCYNIQNRNKDISAILKNTIDYIGNPADILCSNQINGHNYIKYRLFENAFKKSKFCNGLCEIPDNYNIPGYRVGKYFDNWKNALSKMFPWICNILGCYENYLNQLSGKDISAERLSEILMIAYNINTNASCATILSESLRIADDKFYSNIHWDFENNAQIVDNTKIVKIEKTFDKAEDNTTTKFKDPENINKFFTKRINYNELWDCPEYRIQFLDKWRVMMANMFPWFTHEYVKKLRSDELAILNVPVSGIIDGLIVSYLNYPKKSKRGIIIQTVNLLKKAGFTPCEIKKISKEDNNLNMYIIDDMRMYS